MKYHNVTCSDPCCIPRIIDVCITHYVYNIYKLEVPPNYRAFNMGHHGNIVLASQTLLKTHVMPIGNYSGQ
jgi:hypothetical protein